MKTELDLAAVIRFQGKLDDGPTFHPDNKHLLFTREHNDWCKKNFFIDNEKIRQYHQYVILWF